MASIIAVGEKFRAQVRRVGWPVRTKTFPTRKLAEAWARKVEGDIDAGRAGLAAPSTAGTTIGTLVAEYLRQVGEAKDFGRNKVWTLNRLASKEDGLGGVVATALTPERVVSYITEQRRVSGVTAAIDLTYLGGVLKWARVMKLANVHREVLDDARDLLRHMGRLAKSAERDRRPTADELTRLRAWFARHSRSLTVDCFDFILDSGFRPPSEVCGLRWADLNEADKTITIRDRKDPQRKAGNNMVVPLLGRCMEIIKRQPRDSDRIFPLNGKSWSSIFPRACAELGIEDLQLYDLRHEAISRLVEGGKYSIPELMLITGHKDPKQLMRYTQLRARDLHR
jgi:integrase